MSDALQELLAKVEAGEASTMRFEDCGFDGWAELAYHGSLDAARALHEAHLSHHYAQLHMWPMPEMTRVDIGGGHVGRDAIPARAWLIAILRAMIEQRGEPK